MRLLLQTIHLKEGNKLALFKAHPSAEHSICTVDIIRSSFGQWESLLMMKRSRFLSKIKFNYLTSSSQC